MKKRITVTLLIGILGFLFFKYAYKTIPNYTKERGTESVLIWNYDKYHAGYCLEENRILSEDEILKTALGQYFDKGLQVTRNIGKYRVERDWIHGYSKYDWRELKKYNIESPAIDYYVLEDINYSNFTDVFFEKYNPEKYKEFGLLMVFFKNFNAKKVNPMSIVHIEKNIAYFNKSLIKTEDTASYVIYRNCFLTNKNGYKIGCNAVYQDEEVEGIDKKEFLKNMTYESRYGIEVDNCGNIKYDVEFVTEDRKEDLFAECIKHDK